MNVNTNNMNTPTTESLTLQEQGQQLSVLGAFANSEQFQMAKQAAEMLASSSMVPTTYQNNPGSCFIALNTALRLRMDPLMVMQNLYVVHGTPSWSGKFAIALIQTCGKFNGIPDEAERCWNYTQAAQSGPRITKILAYLIFWCGLVTAGGTFLFLIFLLLKNLF